MKKFYYLLLTLAVCSMSYGQDMVITGVIDGPLSGGTPKLIEVYVINDIADLSTYGIGCANNGGGTDGQELAFAGSATAGDFIYISTNAEDLTTYFGIEADYVNSVAGVNGDDALELFSEGVVIDTFGDINTDGSGETWDYSDGWAYRTDSTGPDGATFTDSNWTFSGANAVDGCSSNSSCSSVFPIGSYTSGAVETPVPTDTETEAFCESGVDSDPTILTLTPADITVAGSSTISAISVSSMTIAYQTAEGSTTYCPSWYDATIVVTGGVSDGVSITGCNNEIAGLDLTGFTSLTLTSATNDSYDDAIVMCLGLSVTSVEPSCTAPSEATFTNVTTSSVDASWTAGASETDYEYVVQPLGTGEPTTSGTSVIASTSVTIPGLDSGTDYEIYVRSDCGDGLFSAWTQSTFTTPPACGDTVTYCYDNGVSQLFDVSVDNDGDYITVSIVEGDTEPSWDDLVIYDSSDDSGTELYRANGDHAGVSVTSTTGVISVWVEADSTVSCLSPSLSTGLPDTSLVMDITCAPPPTCIDPSDLTVADITSTTASVSWTANNAETAWEYQVVESGVTPAETGDATSDNPLALIGLTANTTYDVYLRANCGDDGTSEWVSVTFTTEPAPIVPDYTNDFTTFPGEFWTLDQGFTSAWTEDGFANNGATGAARSNIYSSGNNNKMYSPVFDLSAGTYYLNLRAAVATWNSTTNGSAMGSDDSVTVSISTDGGTTWTALHVWDVNNTPPIEGVDMPEVDLSSYSSNSARFAIIMDDGVVNDPEDYDFFIDDFQITTTSLGIDEASRSQFTYFPNPVNDVLTIKAQKAVEDITVFNMLGQVVKRQAPNTMNCTVDLSAMQSGAYFVQVSIGNTVETVRVLKK